MANTSRAYFFSGNQRINNCCASIFNFFAAIWLIFSKAHFLLLQLVWLKTDSLSNSSDIFILIFFLLLQLARFYQVKKEWLLRNLVFLILINIALNASVLLIHL